jgi:hypothetical protein
MQKIKLNQKKTALFRPSPFDRNFFPNAGSNKIEQPNALSNGVIGIAETESPKIELSFEEFEIKSLTDIPALKVILANLVETTFPLVLWRGEQYDQIGQWTDEQAVARASELLNSASQEDIQKLYERRHPAEIAFGEGVNIKDIVEKIGREEFQKLILSIPAPNRPILPKQS